MRGPERSDGQRLICKAGLQLTPTRQRWPPRPLFVQGGASTCIAKIQEPVGRRADENRVEIMRNRDIAFPELRSEALATISDLVNSPRRGSHSTKRLAPNGNGEIGSLHPRWLVSSWRRAQSERRGLRQSSSIRLPMWSKRATIKPKTMCAGVKGRSPGVRRVCFALASGAPCGHPCASLCARSRVLRAPGFPCALFVFEGIANRILGRLAPRECEGVS